MIILPDEILQDLEKFKVLVKEMVDAKNQTGKLNDEMFIKYAAMAQIKR